MGEEDLATCVLDTGALNAIERADRRAREFFRERTGPIVVPAPVLAQAWRDGSKQVRLARLVASPSTVVEPLDDFTAKAVGVLLGRSGTADVVDASVVVSARRHQALVLTSDAADLLRIDPHLVVEEL